MQVDSDTLLKTIGEQHVELNLMRRELQMAEARNTVYENAMREEGLDPDAVIAKASDTAMRIMERRAAGLPDEPAAEAEAEAAEEPELEPANGKV